MNEIIEVLKSNFNGIVALKLNELETVEITSKGTGYFYSDGNYRGSFDLTNPKELERMLA